MWERHGDRIAYVVGTLVVQTLPAIYPDRDEANAIVDAMNEKGVRPSVRAA
jgi:hypothetical protein